MEPEEGDEVEEKDEWCAKDNELRAARQSLVCEGFRRLGELNERRVWGLELDNEEDIGELVESGEEDVNSF